MNYISWLIEANSKKPLFLYHASGILTNILKPKKSKIGNVTNIKKYSSLKEWEKKAVFAVTEPSMCLSFGLERLNIMWPGLNTEDEVESWTYGCYLSPTITPNILVMCYYNCKPTKPVFLYKLDSTNFTLIQSDITVVEQWYSTKNEIPISVEKFNINNLTKYWKIINKNDWEIKKKRYREKGYYKK